MKHWSFAALLILGTGCISIGNPFVNPFTSDEPDYTSVPVDALRDAARDIEHAIQKGERQPTIADRGGVVVNTDDIKQAIRMRAARAELINQLLDGGHVCEQRNGLIAVLRSGDYKKDSTSRERDRNAAAIMNENMNRRTIFEGVLKAGKFPRRSLSAIQATFHEARIECMNKGQKYEDAAAKTLVKE